MTKLSTSAAKRAASSPSSLTDHLHDLARNLWWCWHPDGRRLFESIDPRAWARVEHSPMALLAKLPARRLAALQRDEAFTAEAARVHRQLAAYLSAKTWYEREHGGKPKRAVAYFSMEFGLHESLPIFAGGLGVLAGDHFKSASDVGLPIVGVGMFWRRGYTRQRIEAGRQVDRYDTLSADRMPLTEVRRPAGRAPAAWRCGLPSKEPTAGTPLRLRVPVGGETVVVRAWRLDVGRVPIFLLDTDLPENAAKHRKLTERLYSGDRDTRIRQEIVLGIGGWMLLRALKLPVAAWHLNEGHAAFCAVQRVAEQIDDGQTFSQAVEAVARSTVFTTHTPVPEGNESFEPKLVERYFAPWAEATGVGWDRMLALSRVDPTADAEKFGMTPLALRLSDHRNGVSRLHGEVSRGMWKGVWPRVSAARTPIGHITNGVHVPTWMHPAMEVLLDEYLAAGWRDVHDDPKVWKDVARIPAERLWALHMTFKRELCDFVLHKQQQGLAVRGSDRPLDPEVLTIGFARRFATYKRATLIFSDMARLTKLIADAKRPVQLIYAGKAHPADEGGKAFVAAVAKHAASKRFKGRVVLLADYDMEIARHLVAGVDVWLNNPRRPQEASGTSGMKPALHGGLNLSILDGWWPEACKDGRNGWSIGKPIDSKGTKAEDQRDAQSLYTRLTRDVVPTYYRRDRAGLPTGWIKMMRSALTTIPAQFSSHRMVKEYLSKYYGKLLGG
jgi:starch phosphorylase